MASQVEDQITQVVASIKKQRTTLDAEAKRLRTPAVIDAFDKWDHNSWCLSVVGDCLVRLRLFTEQNFNFIETIGTIAVARYIFELSVWLHLFKLDSRYGLVYYGQLLDTQSRYWRDYREQLDREIALLQRFQQMEQDTENDAINQIKDLSDPEKQKHLLLALPKAVSELVDEQAARHFSIYADQAKVKGYGFQAYLVEQKVVPQIEKALADIDSEKGAFDAHIPQDVRSMIPGSWQWRQMAKKVALTDEYDFIYTCSSKLLHATPASITTDQKNLGLPELVMFLKYINVKIADVIELAREYPSEAA